MLFTFFETSAMNDDHTANATLTDAIASQYLRDSRDIIIGLDQHKHCIYFHPNTGRLFDGADVQIWLGQAVTSLPWTGNFVEQFTHVCAQQEDTLGFGFQTTDTDQKNVQHLKNEHPSHYQAVLKVWHSPVAVDTLTTPLKFLLTLHPDNINPADSYKSETVIRDKFLGAIAHELRSPLNGIQSWSYVLESQVASKTPLIERALTGIKTGIDQQVRLIENLSDTSHLLNNRLTIEKKPVIFRTSLDEAIKAHSKAIAEKKIQWVQDVRLNQEKVEGDAERLVQIVSQLLSNALQFTPDQGRICLSAMASSHFIRVTLQDNGMGIRPDHLPYLFSSFLNPARYHNKAHGGVGVGLALVKRLVELHGGQIRALSEGENKGATFIVEIPRILQAEIAAISDELPDGPSLVEPLPSIAGLHVMVIDDQKEARNALCSLLALAGARVSSFGSGKAAREEMATYTPEQYPDVIVCDIAMPQEDGYTTLKNINAMRYDLSSPKPAHPIPAIALTGFSERHDHQKSYEAGFHCHLNKPVMPAELLIRIVFCHAQTKKTGHP